MTNGVIRVALERDVRTPSRHPHVERIMQKQIRQDGAYDPSLRRSRHSRHDAAILHLHRSLQPALDVEQHPRSVRMTTDRPERQLPIDAVEIGFYVEIEHPVVAPTALTSSAHGVDRRFAGPVAIGVGMERRLQTRLQVATGNFLSDTVSDSWNAQRARTAIHLRNIHASHRRRKVAPRRQPVPELIEVVCKISLKVRNRLSVYSSRSLVGLHLLEGFPDFPFGDVERLYLVHRLLLLPVGFSWPVVSAEQCSPFGPAPLQSLHPYYELLRPCAPHRYSRPCGFDRLRLLPW